jgi:hypothetical protein
MKYYNTEAGLVVPHRTPVYTEGNEFIGTVENKNDDDEWFVLLSKNIAADPILIVPKPIYETGKIKYLELIVFTVE